MNKSIGFRDRSWDITSYTLLGLVFIAVMGLYLPFLQTLLVDWDTNDNYSHGYFVPVIAIYMIFSVRKDLIQIPPFSNAGGLLVVLCGLAMLVVAKIGAEFFIQRFSFIVVLLGIVLFLCGYRWLKKLALPILYLVFMIPLPAVIWNKIAFPMQLFGSYLTEQVIYFIGIPVYREGNVLHLAETTLEVVAACSGLRSLVIMFAMSSLLVWMSELSFSRKLILFFAAAPAAIIANIVRLTATAILASKYGSEVADGFLHDFSGLVTFIVGLLLLLSVRKIISRKYLP